MNLEEIEIIEVSAHYGETKSLPDYSNVKPGYSLKAAVKLGQDPEAVKQALAEQVRLWVWEDCDTALEREGLPARFYQGPRYDAVREADEEYIAIVPSDVELPGLWKKSNRVGTGRRLESLVKLLDREWSNYTVEDFSQNPEALPELVQIQTILTRRNSEGDTRYCIVLPYGVEADDLGKEYRYLPRHYYTIFAAGAVAFISKQARDNEAELIDALDGDLSKLPDLTPKQPENAFIAGAGEVREAVMAVRETIAKAAKLFDELDDDDYSDDDDDDDEEPGF